MENSVKKDLNNYLNRIRYKSALQLSIIFTIVFSLLTIAHIYESIENLIVMTIGFFICLFSFVYTWKTKKYQLVYWTFSILGVNIVGLALNFLPETTHFGDFIWMFSALALALYGLPRKIAYLLVGLAFVYIGLFSFININTNIELLQPRNDFQKFSLFAELIAGISSGIYIVYLMISFHNFSEKTVLSINKDLILQNEKIKAQDEEKSILVKEVHHRVKNNLQIISSLLRMQSNEIDNPEARVHFEEAVNRVMSMALIHQKLYQGESLADIKLKEYFEELANDLLLVYKNETAINIQFDIRIEKIGLKSIVPLGLLFNELVSNSLKHAFKNSDKGDIKVCISKEDNSYLFVYQDSGQWKGNDKIGFGLELIETLSEQLDGSYELEKTDTQTIYRFNFQNLNE